MIVQAGSTVLIKGLTSEAGRPFNGKKGTALRFHPPDGRWSVKIDQPESEGGGEGDAVRKIRIQNLEVAIDEEKKREKEIKMIQINHDERLRKEGRPDGEVMPFVLKAFDGSEDIVAWEPVKEARIWYRQGGVNKVDTGVVAQYRVRMDDGCSSLLAAVNDDRTREDIEEMRKNMLGKPFYWQQLMIHTFYELAVKGDPYGERKMITTAEAHGIFEKIGGAGCSLTNRPTRPGDPQHLIVPEGMIGALNVICDDFGMDFYFDGMKVMKIAEEVGIDMVMKTGDEQ
ncbi:hypothetical protein ACHAWF_002160 [Thalassiosira exigua]